MVVSLSSQRTYLWCLKGNRSKKAIALTLISLSQGFRTRRKKMKQNTGFAHLGGCLDKLVLQLTLAIKQ